MLVTATQKVEVPNEEGCFFHLRPLSGAEAEQAEREVLLGAIELMKAMDGVDPASMARNKGVATTETEEESSSSMDPTVLLRFGLVKWEGDGYASVACDDKNKALLDRETRTWAVQTIEEMSVRPFVNGTGSGH